MNEIRTVERGRDEWELDLDVFDWIMNEKGFTTDLQRAEAIGMNHSSLSKIRSGTLQPGRKFIFGTASIGIPFEVIFKRRGN